MRAIPRFLVLLGSAVALLLAAVAPAQAAYAGTGSDPAGDATDGNPAHDIVGFGASYGPADGTLVGLVRLAGSAAAASNDARVHVMAGHRTPGGCVGYPAVGFRAYLTVDSGSARWLRFAVPLDPRPEDGFARREDTDGRRTLRFEITDKRIAKLRIDCAMAWTTDDKAPDVPLDMTAPVGLRAQPELVTELGRLPASQRVGQRRTVRVVLRNPGHKSTGRIRLSVANARGLSVQHPRTVASLKPGARRTVTLTTSLTRRAKPTTRLRVTATAGDLRARVDGQLRRGSESSRGGSGSGGSGTNPPPRLCNRWMPDISGNTGGSLVLVPC